MQTIKKSFILILCLLCYFTNTQAAISTPTSDSTYQQVIEFTHKKKRKKKTYFFQKGEKVVIKKKGRLFPIRGKIEGFTEDGIIIKGQEIKVEEIKSIRSKPLLFLTLSTFFLFTLGVFSFWGTTKFLIFQSSVVSVAAVSFTPFIVAMMLGLILIMLAIYLKKREILNLKRKWNAKITIKKLPIK